MSWQDDLLKKSKELKKEGGEPNVNSRISSGIRSGRVSSIRVPISNKEIERKGGEIKMIPSKGLFDDYNVIDKEDIGAAEKVWKYIPKLIKVILNCRTNTSKIMEKFEIPKDEPKKEETK